MPAMDSSVEVNGLTTAQHESLERVWAQLVSLLQRDYVSGLDMPMDIKNLLGNHGVKVLVNRFSKFIAAKVAMTEDVNKMTIHVKPAFQSWGLTVVPDPVEETETSKKTPKAPRPPNAFILYRQYWHPFVKAAHPELHNNEISIILGKQWNNEDEAVKDEWRRKADEFKKEHAIIYPRYQYQPRKPSEKKRRVTRRKSEALTENGSTSSAVIEKNNAGNLVVTLDDDDLDDATFEAMHHDYNSSLPGNPAVISTIGSVIFTGHTKEAQKGLTIHKSKMERLIKKSPTDAHVDAEFARVFQGVNTFDEAWGMMDPKEQAVRWDMFKKASQNGSGHLVPDA